MKLNTFIFAGLLALSGAAFAGTPAPAASTGAQPGMGHHDHMDMCKEHAQECKDDAAKFDTWCAANADKCMGVKAFAEKRIEWCSSHEKECAEHRKQEMSDMKQFCSKDPSKPHCHAIVARHQPGDQAPSASSSTPPQN